MTLLRPEPPRIARRDVETPCEPRFGSEDLRRIALFDCLDDEDLAQLFPHGEVQRFRAGDVFSIADDAPAVYFVLEGAFCLSMMSPAAKYVVIHTIGRGGYFGEAASLVGATQREYHVHCENAGACFVLSAAQFRKLVRDTGEISDAVLRNIVLDATERADRIYEFAILDLRYRLLAELARLARRRPNNGHRVVIDPAPTHEALAAQVGASREAVTRLMQGFVKQNLIRIPRRREIVITDLARLCAMVSHKTGFLSL